MVALMEPGERDWESLGFMKPRRPQPFQPEMWTNRPGPWKVIQGPPDNGYVDFTSKTVCVPHPYGHVQQGIRTHEGTHLACTPAFPMSHIRRMVEEVSTDAKATAMGGMISTSLDLVDTDAIRAQLESGSEVTCFDMVLWILQFTGCGYDHAYLDGTETGEQFVHWSDLPDHMEDFLAWCEDTLRKGLGRQAKAKMDVLWKSMCWVWQHPGSVHVNDQTTLRLLKEFPRPSKTETQRMSTTGISDLPAKGQDTSPGSQGQPGQPGTDAQPSAGASEPTHGGTPSVRTGSMPGQGGQDGQGDGDKVVDVGYNVSDSQSSCVHGKMSGGRKTKVRVRVVPVGCGQADVFSESRAKQGDEWGYVPGSLQTPTKQQAEQQSRKALKEAKSAQGSQQPVEEGDEQHWEALAQAKWERRDPAYGDVEVEFVLDTMAVEDLTLGEAKACSLAATWQSSESGMDLQFPIEYFGDGRMYRERGPGGTVIIDVSGSMSWDYESLRQAIEQLPSTTIGVYSGRGATSEVVSQVNGSMLLVAKDGRWTDPGEAIRTARLSGGNGVDLEALEWLGQQAEPRVWIGDGEIHSGRIRDAIHNGAKATDIGQCVSDLCRRYEIVRVMSVEDALAILKNNGQTSGATRCWTWESEDLISNVYCA